ncbi:2-C-methyl-D-erythritol 4-phosphate cytidylyltransferase [Alysiella filiformis]|uniref:2-C-methyl-D-erythritol 4-phosphate cytidylyltransferase n=1 Tax=Alysiella filiformis DSM 16848 TaxID=1120981 RepID=A0A286E9E6_9NEIS|nr:2-C-methyl-D-erythritol 4-phosphate cytidylyltransferase [Alysiella filiformis]QMT31417.1 2-C-methyl-D-erythritol 4-phosphate cytidylyltransferase [Alysiella filiformis]UBQ55573.1 2-C-methyl-D-erythritol 4-phosphate cytidylyltransferase [Alysiella filiformis DSM 16848]SOD67532.1 2-C-methyl-D-erythritol 4-phosphate cytidylyltransferase [Alysiella filiformis DSM 16848]
MNTRRIALIPAAGIGSRFGSELPKQYVQIGEKTVLQHTLDVFAANERIDHIAVVISPDDSYFDVLINLPHNGSVHRVGGSSRAQSVFNGVNELVDLGIATLSDSILVHDAARCCLPQTALNRLLDHTEHNYNGGILALPVADTLKQQNAHQHIARTVSRVGMWQAQTPQLFQAALLQRALANVNLNHITDEASAVEQLGISPMLVEGDSRNIKLTRADDAALVAFLLTQM